MLPENNHGMGTGARGKEIFYVHYWHNTASSVHLAQHSPGFQHYQQCIILAMVATLLFHKQAARAQKYLLQNIT